MASSFLAGLGPAIWPRLASERPVHVPRVFEPTWISDLHLPLGAGKAANQTVALADDTAFHRESHEDAVTRAYQDRPRTRIYESLNVRSDGWFSLVALRLAGMLRRQVVCAAYESQAADRNLGAHDDEWLGVIAQMRGVKRWLMWPESNGVPVETVTRVGDVLILPRGVKHEVSTPDPPGYSVHLLFAVTDKPIEMQREESHGAARP
ncbi:hypothetical protein [Streptomyces sp. NPDC006140]|uniref:hypothetical protein n=1 Tax=Streptomyces sp. NPDC006140 TaxID=3154579 RepID=UPI003408B8D4